MNAPRKPRQPRKRRIKLTIEFDGTKFHGWQAQNLTGERTVQAEIEKLLKAFPEASNYIHGAGRTDAGVHALAMVAHYNTNDDIPIEKIPLAFNSRLPNDICILKAEDVGNDFEAQFSCLYRRYIYKMQMSRSDVQGQDLVGGALDRHRVLFLRQKLDVEAMLAAAPLFEGERDFVALATKETRSTVREVYMCRLELSTYIPNRLNLHVAANGFLRNMVRTIVGTLIQVGEGKIAVDDIDDLLASKDRSKMGPKAPAQGLYFAEAGYVPWQDTSS